MKTYPMSDAEKILEKYWGFPSFRPGQDRAVESVLNGNDTLVLFPTGGGKSLCYQVPSLIFDGLTLVISPLVALMEDQVNQLQKLGIRATFINSTLHPGEVEQRLINARNGMYKLLYLSPERLSTDLWKRELPQLSISMIAIDEAHCISEWGHEFRPSYRLIKQELDLLDSNVRWVALTATATPEVKQDILDTLDFENPEIVTGGFSRPNLQWWVTETDRKRDVVKNAVKKGVKRGSGIVYASTRRECEEWAAYFTNQKISASAYHAGLTSDIRSDVQKKWIEGSIPLVTATNAFGMGIDKPDCRFVVHYTLPFSLEAYYQEAGRAGRDGKRSYPILIFKEADAALLKSRILRNYPDPETLSKVYDSLCDDLNLAIGSEHKSFDPVLFKQISKRSGLKEGVVKSSMTILERLEILEQVEHQKPSVGIYFVVSQTYLRDFIKKTETAKGDFIDLLFRIFSPRAFQELQFLDLEYLTNKLNVSSHALHKALNLFQEQDQILKYEWRGEQPLVRLMEPRVRKLKINQKDAYHYKNVLLKKLDYMVRYAQTNDCREVFLRNYFGETGAEPCGNCDNCLKKIKSVYSVSQVDISKIIRLLEESPKTNQELKELLKWDTHKIKKVLNHLTKERRIDLLKDDQVRYRLAGTEERDC